ncbi:hypothetical protein VTN49DRAFT_8119 [Thermomyces lanuginosus]|uniref:uncharacterized protein n=1 Tax=Thermomyces lanuginosus TaxID=5541 RepID=UPI003744245A
MRSYLPLIVGKHDDVYLSLVLISFSWLQTSIHDLISKFFSLCLSIPSSLPSSVSIPPDRDAACGVSAHLSPYQIL